MSDINSSKSSFTMYPLLWLSVCFGFGILAANYLSVGWVSYFWMSSLSALATFLFFKRKFAVLFLSIAFANAGALHFCVENRISDDNRIKNLYDSSRIVSGDPIEISGELAKAPESLVGGKFILIRAEKANYKSEEIEVSGNVRLFCPIPDDAIDNEYRELNLRFGSRIIAACELKREDNYLNPGVGSRTEILDQQEIDATCTVKSPLLIEKIQDSTGNNPIESIYGFRQNVIEEFRTTFDNPTSAVLIASLLGNKYFLDKQTAQVFREGGTFHVLVISGLHITFIGGLLILIVRIFTKNRSIQFALACAVLWIYALAVGAEVPVIRASLMFTILLFPFVINRRGTLMNSLGGSVLILLIWRPEDFFSQSFHLTIVSVGAIVTMAFPIIEQMRAIGRWSPTIKTPLPPNVPPFLNRICEMVYWRPEDWPRHVSRQIWSARLFKAPYFPSIAKHGLQNTVRYIAEGLIVSIVVQVWLLPILLVYFNRFSHFNVILNLWVGVNIAFESFAAIFAVFVNQINHSLAIPFIKLTEFLNFALLSIPQVLIDLDIASRRIPVYSGSVRAIYLLYFIPLIALTILLNYWNPFALRSRAKPVRKRLTAVSIAFGFVVVLGILIILHPGSAPSATGRLQIDFLDVGQGDSALITFPNGATMLVDGGGRLNFSEIDSSESDDESEDIFEPDTQTIGEAVVSKFLWERGYSKIDYILATHADADHIQGLTDVASNFAVETAFVGSKPFGNKEFDKFYSVLTKRGISLEELGRGDTINIDGVKIEVVFPANDDSSTFNSDNNNSIVLRILFRNRKFLLTGDIEKETEKILVSSSPIDADVVKVAHHGSRTSSITEFIAATKANYAIIPVGRKSVFGHPHREVVERWHSSGAKVLETGERGTISISTDGIDLKVDTYLK